MAPDTPTDALGRYVALLQRWDRLSRRQHDCEQAQARRDAEQAQLHAEWAEVRAEHAACLRALQTCPLALDAAIRNTWMLTKAHVALVVEPNPASRGLMPDTLRTFLSNRTWHPLGETDAS